MNQINRFLILVVFLVFTKFVMAQNSNPQTITLSAPGVINFQHLADQELLNPPVPMAPLNAEADEEHQHGIPKHHDVTGAIVTNVVLPTSGMRTQSPAPTAFFNGLTDNGQVIPPDVSGAAGPNHLMETLNSTYRIFNKTGGTVSTLSLTSFWSGVSGSPFSDPHITYDPNTSKWYAVILSTLSGGHAGFFLGVSQTNDPTGSWWEYSVDAQGSTGLFMDYPAIGFNNNWIVITGNMFSGFSFSTTKVFVFNKSNVTSGSGGTVTTFSNNTIFSLEPAVTYDANVNTEYMLTEWDNNSGGNCYSKIFTITGTQSSPVFTAGNTVGVNQPYSQTVVNAKQLGTSNRIATNDTRMRNCVYRNSSLYAAQTVYLPSSSPTRASSQVWQINPSNSSLTNFFRIDDNTATNFYYFASVSINSNDDVLVGYTVSSASTYASSGYSYRTSADAANTLEDNYTYKAGQSSYYKTFGGGVNRWGDYSATTVDPSDGSFWTLQEFAYTPSNNWGTTWANVAASTGATCNTPSSLTAASITSSGATLSWGTVSGATGYNVQYRPTGNLTWTSATSATTSLAVSGLIESTQYEFQVQTTCSGGSTSSFSASANFTTLSSNPCTETFEPNGTKNTAASISVGVDISSQISISGDIDWYSFTNTTGASNIKVTLTTLPANYNETLHNSSNAQVAVSKKSGTQDESMIFNTSVIGTYKIKVVGANGEFSNTQCYTLHVYTSSTPFKLGDGFPLALSDNTLKVYPNPNAGVMTLEYISNADAMIQVRIFDITGKLLVDEQQQIVEGANVLHPDLTKLVSGAYFIEVSNGNDISRGKFMIEK
ncbi:MAG TPA: T9SS type A sorting domain-containing protein [Chitinophagales bacterium]|nr:T9SS type A sorting domain-containing protein [Chitinophagales bacterium]